MAKKLPTRKQANAILNKNVAKSGILNSRTSSGKIKVKPSYKISPLVRTIEGHKWTPTPKKGIKLKQSKSITKKANKRGAYSATSKKK